MIGQYPCPEDPYSPQKSWLSRLRPLPEVTQREYIQKGPITIWDTYQITAGYHIIITTNSGTLILPYMDPYMDVLLKSSMAFVKRSILGTGDTTLY